MRSKCMYNVLEKVHKKTSIIVSVTGNGLPGMRNDNTLDPKGPIFNMLPYQSFAPIFLASLISCLTAKSAIISSLPPPTTNILKSLPICSTGPPTPPC